MNRIELITRTIEQHIESFIDNIVSKYPQINRDELLSLWSGKPLAVSRVASRTTSSDATGCPYKYSKGQKAGVICGAKSKDGSLYCSMHKKYEGAPEKEKKILPEPKASNILLKRHKKLDKVYHPETNLVFRSADDKVVIGKVEDDKLLDLSSSDISMCKKWGFAFSEEKLEEEPEKKIVKKPVKKVVEKSEKKDEEEPEKKVVEKTEEEPEKKVVKKTEEEPEKKVVKKPEKKVVKKTEEEPEKKVVKKTEEEPEKKVVEKSEEEPEKKVVKKTEEEPEKKVVKKPVKKVVEKSEEESEKKVVKKTEEEPEKKVVKKTEEKPVKKAKEKEPVSDDDMSTEEATRRKDSVDSEEAIREMGNDTLLKKTVVASLGLDEDILDEESL